MLYENMLLSKVIEDGNFFILNKYNVKPEDFTDGLDTYNFIQQYVKDNGGTVPDYRTVVDKVETFEYEPEVTDTFQFLCQELKSQSAKRQAYKMLQLDASKKFSELEGEEFVGWLKRRTLEIEQATSSKTSDGTNFATNGLERKQHYLDSKESRTNTIVPTPYKSLNEKLSGGNELGDYLLIQAYTNRGKSWIASDMGLSAWRAGFAVLHYSPELSKVQQLNRLDTLNGHFMNTGLRIGQLPNEDKYLQYLDSFTSDNHSTDYVVKSMEDIDSLSVEQIEADLSANPDLKVVVIDGFNLMSHKGANRGDSSRNNMSNTSRALRQLFSRHGVLGIVVHQTNTSAEKENLSIDEVGNRVPNPAKIHQYSETIAVVQDACTVLSFDQIDGVGKLLIAKARMPVVGETIDLLCSFNEGRIYEHAVEETFDF